MGLTWESPQITQAESWMSKGMSCSSREHHKGAVLKTSQPGGEPGQTPPLGHPGKPLLLTPPTTSSFPVGCRPSDSHITHGNRSSQPP